MNEAAVVAQERTILGWLAVVARLITGGVWIWAGMDKISNPYAAVLAVRAYEILPSGAATVVGHTLPILEIVVGVALVLGLLTRLTGAISLLLFIAFIIGISSVWARGILIDCGCFGGGGVDPNAASKYPWEIARDVALGLLSIFIIFFGNRRWSLDRLLFRSSINIDEEL
ncbi:MauE/DoxX family redox-associated membrane protein [Nocardioides sp.]|uniref:MauE/DoxX family redox-associated membrane protein n=1 Tax=Nocardioides sp. TaxID=35761 RepID=UPI00262CC0EF|nr:MauE/DoxX family redox-associated membrane protein [Nocardioides sp.]